MKKILTQSLSISLEKVVPFYMMLEGLSGGVFEQTHELRRRDYSSISQGKGNVAEVYLP